MSTAIENLQPQELWRNFTKLNAVPRASKKEEQVIEFMLDFGRGLGLQTQRDEIGNVVIKKPATPGYEQSPIVILQSHLDMVHQKNNDTDFDFATQGIDMYVEDDWVRARGTTLGADNGLGVAAIMALLESTDIPHPALEALFTIDEETGMTGVKHLDGSMLQGSILLNLDTEEDHVFGIGCAGGVDVSASREFELQEIDDDENFGLQISIKGLTGGHSGMEIHKGLGNSNLLLAEMLNAISSNFRIHSIDGGGLRNAIPREATALIAVEDVSSAEREVEEKAWELKKKYAEIDPNFTVLIDAQSEAPEYGLSVADSRKLVNMLLGAKNGVYSMDPNIEGLVQTSNNVARVELNDGHLKIHNLTRSSSEESKMELANSLKENFDTMDLHTTFEGSYPGWQPNPQSQIVRHMDGIYRDMFGEAPTIEACHAGLECGLLGERKQGLDMVSFGPNILGAHSPDERASIKSTQKFWDFLLRILRDMR
ncbi:MAG: aminoacyl-histidine dipeptidase [Weeksellaceae bacterium]|nr:aminoacyl-histidine dipeptidase [Weeksellaceae bacterium]